jgi:N-acyl-L-homoserine lactone synthetase
MRVLEATSTSKTIEILTAKDGNYTARILDPHDDEDSRLFEEFRYKYWIEEFNYIQETEKEHKESRKRESDKYDEHSVHFGVFDSHNDLVGYSRFILPGKHGLQVQVEFNNLLHSVSDFEKMVEHSVESSRLIVQRELARDRHQAAQLIYKMKYRFMKRNQYRYWYHISELKLIRALKRQMYPFSIIGEGKEYQNGVCYPALMDLQEVDQILLKKAPDYYRWLNEGLNDTLYYNTFMSRNTAFLDNNNIDKIKNARILFAGCGLGSMIAVLCARMGFTKFIVADFDKVELSNLNRQTYTTDDIGKNKAVAIADILLQIQPDAEIEIIPEKLTPATSKRLIDSSDIIINTVDFNETCYAINDMATAVGKPVLFPLNAGFGGLVLVFDKSSISLREMTGGAHGNIGFLNRLAESLEGYNPPDYLSNFLGSLNEFESMGYLPQTGIAVNITSSLVVLAIIGYLSGWPIRYAPYPITSDAMFAINNVTVLN